MERRAIAGARRWAFFLLNGKSIMFTEAGAIPCIYTGTASGSPPTSMSGTISCVGTFQGTSYNATGTWQATKQ